MCCVLGFSQYINDLAVNFTDHTEPPNLRETEKKKSIRGH